MADLKKIRKLSTDKLKDRLFNFTIDQVNFISKIKNPRKAVELDKNIARSLGIGNSTGLGMAPFIVNHPILLNNWILARETALK